MKYFSPRVNGMFVNKLVKKLNKTNKNPKFKSESIFTEKTPTDKSGAMKVSQKLTTQYGQLIFREIFTKDNTEPN